MPKSVWMTHQCGSYISESQERVCKSKGVTAPLKAGFAHIPAPPGNVQHRSKIAANETANGSRTVVSSVRSSIHPCCVPTRRAECVQLPRHFFKTPLLATVHGIEEVVPVLDSNG